MIEKHSKCDKKHFEVVCFHIGDVFQKSWKKVKVNPPYTGNTAMDCYITFYFQLFATVVLITIVLEVRCLKGQVRYFVVATSDD